MYFRDLIPANRALFLLKISQLHPLIFFGYAHLKTQDFFAVKAAKDMSQVLSKIKPRNKVPIRSTENLMVCNFSGSCDFSLPPDVDQSTFINRKRYLRHESGDIVKNSLIDSKYFRDV